MKKLMKKITAMAGVLALGFSLTACGGTEDQVSETKNETVGEAGTTTGNSLEGVRIIHLISNTRGDGGNHDMAAMAVEKLRDEYGAEIKIVEMGNTSTDVAKYLPTT